MSSPLKTETSTAMSRRQPRAGETEYTTQVPTNKIGLIIGKGGATMKRLQQTFGVHIDIPGQELQNGPQTPIRIIGQHDAIQACVFELAKMCGIATDGDGLGGGEMPVLDGGMGGPAAGGRDSQVFLFRVAPDTRELQLLLQLHAKSV